MEDISTFLNSTLTLTTLLRNFQIVPPDDYENEITKWNKSVKKKDVAINQAWLRLKSDLSIGIHLFTQHDQCFKCPQLHETKIKRWSNYSMVIQSQYANYITIGERINKTYVEVLCSDRVFLKERGDYWLNIYKTRSFDIRCELILINSPPNIYLPILWAVLILTFIAGIYNLLKYLIRKKKTLKCRICCCKKEKTDKTCHDNDGLELDTVHCGNGHPATDPELPTTETDPHPEEDFPPPPQPKKKRVKSLDAFRGLCLIVMIFVNYGGGGYWFFAHAYWNGLLVADLVFPWFIFIMGTSMAISFNSMVKRGKSKPRMLLHILRRSAMMFLIGISLTTMWGNDLTMLRIPGVLQRFAIAYLIVGITHMLFVKKISMYENKCCQSVQDVVYYWAEWFIMLGVLAVHLALTFGLAVPRCPRGYLGPGGLHEGGKYYECVGGAAGYIDRLVLSAKHIFQWPTIRAMYHKPNPIPYDPEGILGDLSAAFQCFLGLQAGKILLFHEKHEARITRWIVWGVVTGIIGAVLCKGTLDEGWIPINKNLWSVSYVFVTSGMAFILLTMLYTVIDIWNIWGGQPLFYPGMNSIVIYACHEIFHGYFPVRWKMPDETLHWQKLFMAFWGTGVWIVVSFIMLRKKIFVKL